MKIQCECGHMIHDGTDGLGHKGHLIPDRRWDELADAIDAAIETGETPRHREAAAMRMRVLLNEMSRTVWQCDACGILYMDNGHRRLRAFRPAGDEDVLGILSGR
ncbi:hypothetical protein [Oricola sp.]|uniref:hypothetical protein n=1 Tax=Oricola sp. TaxID=1979950 RepID=UPI0035146BEA